MCAERAYTFCLRLLGVLLLVIGPKVVADESTVLFSAPTHICEGPMSAFLGDFPATISWVRKISIPRFALSGRKSKPRAEAEVNEANEEVSTIVGASLVREETIKHRIAYLMADLEKKFAKSEVTFVGRGGEGIVIRIRASGDRPAKILKFPLDPTDARVIRALENEAKYSQEARRHDGLGADHLIHSHGLITLETTYGRERVEVMEEINDGSIADHLSEWGPWRDPLEVLSAWKQIALGVRSLHRIHVVHRDIKPTNILLNRGKTGRENFKVADFGLAMDVQNPPTGEGGELFSGTLSHMSENQLNGGAPRLSDDMRGMQVTFIEMLSGKSVWALDAADKGNHLEHLPINGYGTFPWINAVPDKTAAVAHPLLVEIANTRFRTVDELLAKISLAEQKIQSERSTP